MLNSALPWRNNLGQLKGVRPPLPSSCSLGPYPELVLPAAWQEARVPDRPLVWADNVNGTTQRCRHQPRGRGRASRMSLPESLGGDCSPPPSAQRSCQCNKKKNQLLWFFRCLYKISHPSSVPFSSFLFGLNPQTTSFHLVSKKRQRNQCRFIKRSGDSPEGS